LRCSVAWFLGGVEHWLVDGPDGVTEVSQTPNTPGFSVAVRRWGRSFIVERVTAQSIG
jgi:hypothetical protein